MASVKRSGDSPKKDIKALTKAILKNADKIRLSAFNTVKGQYVRRIFNQGLASDGSKIGTYTTSSAEFRRKIGRQTNFVDLEITGTLRRSIAVGKSSGRSVLGLATQPEPKISTKGGRLTVVGTSNFNTVDNAVTQEDNFNKEIFAPSKSELKRGEATILKEIDRIAVKVLSR